MRTFFRNDKLCMGPGTLEVPTALFARNRNRLVDRLKGLANLEKGSVVVLQGGSEVPFNDTDCNYLYRQVPIPISFKFSNIC